jgi:hypothetical protein
MNTRDTGTFDETPTAPSEQADITQKQVHTPSNSHSVEKQARGIVNLPQTSCAAMEEENHMGAFSPIIEPVESFLFGESLNMKLMPLR